jgi:cytochrome c553
LPDGEGKGLVLAACTQCHNLGSIVLQRKTMDGWERTVRDMVSRGAQVRPEEIVLISDYLTRSFGPAAPPPAQQASVAASADSLMTSSALVILPEGRARALILAACSECHGLNRITDQRKDEAGWRATVKDMVRLGARLKPDEAGAVVTYLTANFGGRQSIAGASGAAAPTAPGKPPDLSRMLPDGEGKGLILATCVQCHGLQEIVGQRKDGDGWRRTVQDMVSRGAQITPEEAGLISSYLERSRGK